MLELKNICKKYSSVSGDVTALDNINLQFRRNEFVSILGPSGGGKTTMLNIIGGLDQYTSGDLVIGGVSTKKYKDRDWDSYRNHSIGFIFQSYNLIMHQTVLENVELALTLSGVSKGERKERAIEALTAVGLADHIYKKPTQMSGGQMQRVAIARALINNPDILLADEPTGALDTVTSVQIMELLKEIAKDKLVIMVTHNPELAEQYSTRIIRIRDGKIIDDSDPYITEQIDARVEKTEKTSMTFFTALSLSFKNLLTKKGRTFLTAFAGSIGIIGIASILSLSNGIQLYVDTVQQETLSSYPIQILEETTDMSALMGAMLGISPEGDGSGVEGEKEDGVYANPVMYRMMKSMLNAETEKNNLADFKKFLDSKKSELEEYTFAIQYGYDIALNIYAKDPYGEYSKSDFYDLMFDVMGGDGGVMGSATSYMESMSAINLWQELITDPKTGNVSALVTDQYDLVYGKWPSDADELLLVLTSNNEISDLTLYALGLIDRQTMMNSTMAAMTGGEDTGFDDIIGQMWTYKEICDIPLKLILPTDYYKYDNKTDLWVDISDNTALLNKTIDKGYELKISGIVRPKPEATATALSGSLCYTSKLVEYYIEEVNDSPMVREQKNNEDINIISGKPFIAEEDLIYSNKEKIKLFKEYVEGLTDAEKADLYLQILSVPDEEAIDKTVDMMLEGYEDKSVDEIIEEITKNYSGEMGFSEDLIYDMLSSYDKEELIDFLKDMMREMLVSTYATAAEEAIASIESAPSDEDLESMKKQIREGVETAASSSTSILDSSMSSMGGSSMSFDLAGMLNLPTGKKEPTKNSIMGDLTGKTAKVMMISEIWCTQTNIPTEVVQIYLYTVSDAELDKLFDDALTQMAVQMYESYSGIMPVGDGDAKVAKAFDEYLAEKEDSDFIYYYDNFMPRNVSDITYADLLKELGCCDEEVPSSINIYPIDFEKKELIADMITDYNNTVGDEEEISYTDYMAMLMSSVSNIIDAISVALIAFVSISLVVSSIMIGIITYISVLERTKEIGILRAIGASKKDVARVFNAETLIIGLSAGVIGIVITLLLTIPANIIIKNLTDISNIANLPVMGAIALILISVFLTMFAGLVPSRVAANKDPVESLRSE